MDVFGPDIQYNQTFDASTSLQSIAHTYSAEEIAIILGALGATFASVVYAFKNIKHSTCCAGLFTCDQRTEIPPSKNSIIIESSNV